MDEHHEEHHQSDEHFISATSVVSILTQAITSGLDEAGYKETARVIRIWPIEYCII